MCWVSNGSTSVIYHLTVTDSDWMLIIVYEKRQVLCFTLRVLKTKMEEKLESGNRICRYHNAVRGDVSF